MGLRFEHVFTVKAPAERVWAYLSDPFRVAPALPGAAVTEKVDERTFKGTITVKVGPVAARYKGTARFDSLDAVARTMEMTGSAQDVTGRGGAELRMSSRLVETAPGQTEVSIVSETSVTGILAQFGRGMIQDVSNQMFQRFTEAVRAELEQEAAPEASARASASAPEPAAAPPIEVVSFGTRVLGRAAGRALGRPGVWAAFAAVLLLVWWLWSR
ncbi:MAG TPA: SRPBCC family protein [Vicinamibacteria bacterium]|nr:SRPBCC family protein [Vicinamibacteria bacterium]